jgi:hypothetical protein
MICRKTPSHHPDETEGVPIGLFSTRFVYSLGFAAGLGQVIGFAASLCEELLSA